MSALEWVPDGEMGFDPGGREVKAAADDAIAALEAEVAVAEALAAERTEQRNVALSRLAAAEDELERVNRIVVSQSQQLGNTRSQREHELIEALDSTQAAADAAQAAARAAAWAARAAADAAADAAQAAADAAQAAARAAPLVARAAAADATQDDAWAEQYAILLRYLNGEEGPFVEEEGSK